MRARTPLAITHGLRRWSAKVSWVLKWRPWRPSLTLVSCPCEAEHDEAGENVGGRDETVRSSSAEAHTILEDDGEEVGNSVGNRGREHEYDSEAPDLKIERVGEVLLEVKFFREGIVAILLDAGNDEVDLGFVEELLAHAGLVGELGEVDDEIPSNQANGDCNDTLEDENPAPARETRAEGDGGCGLSLGGTVVNTEPGSSLKKCKYL